MTDKIVVLTTCDSEAAAADLSRKLVELRIAACVHILPAGRSIYRWKEQIEEAQEWLLVIKSSRERFDELRSQIQKLHSYDVPEMIAIPVVDGSEAYLNWLDQELRSK